MGHAGNQGSLPGGTEIFLLATASMYESHSAFYPVGIRDPYMAWCLIEHGATLPLQMVSFNVRPISSRLMDLFHGQSEVWGLI
jgi:hypothetical protein